MNYIKLLFLIVLISCFEVSNAQVTIDPGTTFNILTGTTLTLSQDLTVGTGATLNSDGNIILTQSGSLYDTGNIVFTGNSTLAFNGTATQNLYSSTPLTVASLILNNPTGLAPKNSVLITNALTLTNGNYNADTAHPVFFMDTALNPVETNANHIVGRAVMSPRSIGTNALNFLGCNISFGADIGQVTISRISGADAIQNIGPGYTIAQNWQVHSTNDQLTPNRNLSFSWLSAFDNGRDMTAMYLYAAPAPYTTYTVLNDTATNVSATDPRVYFRPNISQFGRSYTLSDNKALYVNSIPTPVAKVIGFPNPFSSNFNLSITKSDDQPVQVQVIDIAGRVVRSNTYSAGNNAVISIKELSDLAAGTYLLHVFNDNFANTLKIVKAN